MNRHRSTQPDPAGHEDPRPAQNPQLGAPSNTDASTKVFTGDISRVDQAALAELLSRVAAGDREAFTAFYQLTSRRVHGLARRIIVDAEIAQNITQEIYVLVWQGAQRYNPAGGSVMAWLMTMAHRKSVDKVRSTPSIRHTVPAGIAAETPADSSDARAMTGHQGTLYPLQRQALSLAYDECLTHREIAGHLSLSLPTVRTGISTALAQLRASRDGA
ncbi:RNA polymerase sigma-70 factor (ECF subfamily) [Arthrobacter sp. CAN_A6]|uniref:sigma-70 family RNA polymerase sigma factor n=1 Tax=Arthrobacter sp. CAN_A6 TaxID=2787721 RepID=UPI0018C988B3